MKKIFLVSIASLTLHMAAVAQTAGKYSDLQVFQPGFKNYIAELHIDGGQSASKSLIRDKDGNKMKFAKQAEALNYVAEQGWELVSSWHGNGITHFILKKK